MVYLKKEKMWKGSKLEAGFSDEMLDPKLRQAVRSQGWLWILQGIYMETIVSAALTFI